MLQTNDPGIGGAAVQPSGVFTSRPPTSSCQRMTRQEAVVAVLAHAPSHVLVLGSGARRVVEDAEEDEGIGRVASREIRRVEPQAQGQAFHEDVAEAGESLEVREHVLAESGQIREQVAPVDRGPGPHHRMVVGQLGAEVEAFLPVGPARGELAARGKVAAPRAAPRPCATASSPPRPPRRRGGSWPRGDGKAPGPPRGRPRRRSRGRDTRVRSGPRPPPLRSARDEGPHVDDRKGGQAAEAPARFR